MSDERRRGFFRASDHQAQELERWAYPDYSEDRPEYTENAFNYQPQPIIEEFEPEEEPGPPPLTAADLEAMQQSAYEEGLEQGKQAGHADGFKAGHAEGLAAGNAEGLEQGLQQGLVQAQQQITEQVNHLATVAEKLLTPINQVDREVEDQVMQLALGLAKELIRVEVKTNPQVILNTIREVVATLPVANREITMHLHPEDIALVKENFTDEDLHERKWKLISEPGLNRGDLQVNSQDTSVDYFIDERIRHSLTTFEAMNSSVREQSE
ncbi:flagellar assembly protein FliH [Photobacterium leiognathi]|uniref:flagellar assembly protein FliH n=1 Tax=Photobacterium leiognathi TaxID=553611 RepID=UPI000208840E|nr:flagellar assembly protein FliH [Photobacterium leiognathi]PSW54473.1 flagellar assembly protein FliH [Photobacterium leiognathi subsp. mandapamensis]GAA03517.1 flagellar assembly FliH family protein [Photobacterium leiognathi subsp. mandapamensis svers.1.1.]